MVDAIFLFVMALDPSVLELIHVIAVRPNVILTTAGVDADPGSASLRTLGTGPNQAMAGDDSRVLNTIHTNVAGEIAGLTSKGSPVSGDLLIIEDSAAGNVKKRIQLGSIGGTDELAKVSANDTTSGFLNGKLVAGTNITLTELNDGANETLEISAAGGVTIISPSSIGADQNDWSPTSWSTANLVRITSSAAYNITGLDASATQIVKKLINVGSFNIYLKHQDAGSIAANRMICFTGADIILQPDDSIDIFNDTATGRWRAGV